MAFVDWSRLTELRDDIGAEAFGDVACLFVEEIGERLSALTREPVGAKADDFHFLRGSAANLGFSNMALACEAAEAACNAGQPPDIAAVAAGFAGALREAAPRIPELATAA